MTGTRSRGVIRVLHSAGRSSHVSFIDLIEPVGGEVLFISFSWKSALVKRYDVFHVHWPEALVRGNTWRQRASKSILFWLLYLRIRAFRVPVVMTVHNLSPHEAGSARERWLLGFLNSAISVRVWMASGAGSGPGARDVNIPHPIYEDLRVKSPARRPVAGSLLYFGQVRDYKNLPHLLTVFAEIEDASLSLTIAGSGPTAQLRALEALVDSLGDARVKLVLETISDEKLVKLLASSGGVVLPYSEVYNSGVALYALTFSVPVLMPDSNSTRSFAEEVGGNWVSLYDGPLTAARLEQFAVDVESMSGAPRLDSRSADVVRGQYRELYRSLVSRSCVLGGEPG